MKLTTVTERALLTQGCHEITDVINQVLLLAKTKHQWLKPEHFEGELFEIKFNGLMQYDLKGKEWKLFVLP